MGTHLFEVVGMGMGIDIQDMNPHPYPPCTHTHNPCGLPIPMQGPTLHPFVRLPSSDTQPTPVASPICLAFSPADHMPTIWSKVLELIRKEKQAFHLHPLWHQMIAIFVLSQMQSNPHPTKKGIQGKYCTFELFAALTTPRSLFVPTWPTHYYLLTHLCLPRAHLAYSVYTCPSPSRHLVHPLSPLTHFVCPPSHCVHAPPRKSTVHVPTQTPCPMPPTAD